MAIETILVAIGGEDEQRAERLAEVGVETATSGTRVVVGYTFTEEEFADAITQFGFDRSADALAPGDVADRIASVSAAHDILDEADTDATVDAAVGESGAEAFVTMAADYDADRVVVGGERRSPAGKAVFGSAAQTILLDAPCPVVYVRGDAA